MVQIVGNAVEETTVVRHVVEHIVSHYHRPSIITAGFYNSQPPEEDCHYSIITSFAWISDNYCLPYVKELTAIRRAQRGQQELLPRNRVEELDLHVIILVTNQPLFDPQQNLPRASGK